MNNVTTDRIKQIAWKTNNVKSNFNDREDVNRRWGGGIMGAKSQERTRQKEKAVAREAAKRMQA